MTTMIMLERFQAHDELDTCRTQHLQRRVTRSCLDLQMEPTTFSSDLA